MKKTAQHILLVDDNATSRKLLKVILEAEGYNILEASDGEDAMKVLEGKQVDAILSDILMPNMDGFELFYELRKTDKGAVLPFIFLTTTYSSPNDEKLALDLGGDKVLKKPVSSEELLPMLEEIFKDPKYKVARSITPPKEINVLRSYRDALVTRLEEKAAELESQAEQLKEFSSAIEQTADNIVITNKNGIIEYANPAFEATSGYTKEFAIGKTPAILKSGKHSTAFYEKLWSTILSGKVFREEFINRRSNGDLYYEQQTISPIVDRDGNIVHFVATGKDITEHKKTDERLRSTHSSLKHLLDHSPAVLFRLKIEEGRILPYVTSENITRLLGFTVDESRSFEWWSLHLHPDDRERAVANVQDTLKSETMACEYRLRHKDGHYVWIEDTRRVLRDSIGRSREIIGVWIDITERKQAQSQVAYQANLLAQVNDAIIAADEHYHLTAWNAAAEAAYGWKADEVLGRDIRQTIFTEWADINADQMRDNILEAGSWRGEATQQRKDGTRFPVEMSSVVIHDDGGKIAGFVSTIRDITARKKAEDELRETHTQLTHLLKNTPAVIYALKIENDTLIPVKVSENLTRLLGYSVEEVMNFSWWINAIHPDDRNTTANIFSQVLKSGSLVVEYRIRHKNGSYIWIEDNLQVVRKEDGKPEEIVGLWTDITERKKAEANLRESTEQFRLIAENVADLIAVLDVNGKRLYCSPSYKNILGDPQGLIGTDSLSDIHPDDREKVRNAFLETVRTGIDGRPEFRSLTKDGIVRHMETQYSAIRDDKGKVSTVLAVCRDVTEKKKLEAQVLRAQRMEGIGTLAAGIAHDLNNVLAPITMGIEMLKTKVVDKEGQKMLRTLEASAQRGSGMIKQVLAFARGISGERMILQAGHIIREMQKIVQETFPKSIHFRTEISSRLWSVSADATQLHQVLLNLCVNARDAMPGGGLLTISAENTVMDEHYALMSVEAKAGPYVVLTVTDTGTGIPPELLDKVFDPFFTTKEIGKGTGLGLSTVHSIVKSHGGFINVYSEMGRGTKFRVYLPAETSAEESQTEVEQGELPTGHGELILVVDDEASIRDICQVTLEAYGYNVLTAADGTEAVVQYAQSMNEIQLVITDMMMPFMDGRATIRALCKINPEVKIIATSGLMAEEKAIDYHDLSIRDFLAKPYTASKLLTAVSVALIKEVKVEKKE